MVGLLPFAPADAIRSSTPRIPGSLIDAAALAAAETAAAGLPALFHWLMLELRLTGPERQADLLVTLIDGPDVREGLRDALAEPAAFAGCASVRRFLQAWAEPRDPHLAAIRTVAFEWDAPFVRPEPLTFPAIDPRHWGPAGTPVATPAEQVALVRSSARVLFGADVDPAVLACLQRLIAALPSGASALGWGDLRPRGSPHHRLFVSMDPAEVLPWLDAIGWPGERSLVAAWLPRIVAPWERVFLQLEVGAEVTSYLGIEPRQHGRSRSEMRERRRFLDRLVEDGTATAERCAAVLAWSGEMARAGGGREVRNFHLKWASGSGGGEPVVKAYLGYHVEA